MKTMKKRREFLRFTFETRISAGTHIRRLVAFVNAMADAVAHSFRTCKFQVFRAGTHLRLVRPVETIVPSIAKRASIHAFPIPASKLHPRAIFDKIYIYILSEILLSNFPYFPCQCNLNYYCLCLCCTHCSLPRRSRNFLGILRNIPIPRPPCPDNPEHRRKHDSGGCSGRCCIENRYTSIQRSISSARLSNLRISMKLL